MLKVTMHLLSWKFVSLNNRDLREEKSAKEPSVEYLKEPSVEFTPTTWRVIKFLKFFLQIICGDRLA
jgi:hypothetical protein